VGTGGTQRKARGPTRASIDARNFGRFDFAADRRVRPLASRKQPLQPRVLRLGLLEDGDVLMRGVGNTGLRYFGAELLSWRRITSEVLSARTRTRDLPLGAQEKPVIRAEAKLVICFPLEPSKGSIRILSTP
jgi:hypothetical protein